MTERIAIVGIGGLFPGSIDLAGFWNNVVNAVDASREPPPGRWLIPPQLAYDPIPGRPDKVYSLRGYFLDPITPDLDGMAIGRELVNQLDALFSLVLHVGNSAFRDAKMDAVDRSRTGVILGSIALPTDRVSDLAREYLADSLPALRLNPPQPATNSLNRQVTGLPAQLLARALNLGGAAYTIDAACASSLYAFKLAADELLAHRADAMFAGGVSRPDCLYTQMGFSQLRALSVSGRCSPFDARADGLVVGEGAGIFVLKRLADAVQHGDHIYGILAGWGLSNDIEGNLLAPASEGQLRAMREAYRHASWSPGDVDLIECHATGTPIGDAVEYESLAALDSDSSSRCVIGSVKSTVGHLLTGAGGAAMMKVLLALRHKMLPPTANFRQPSSKFNYQRSRYRVLESAEHWARRSEDAPRRAAISGFGFGGINANLLVEEWLPEVTKTVPLNKSRPVPNRVAVAVVGMASHMGSLPDKEAFYRSRFSDAEQDHRSSRIEELRIPVGEFPIPPNELEELLPQQLLMLQVAAAAIEDVRGGLKSDGSRRGVFIGLNLDLNTTNFHVRWWLKQHYGDQLATELDAALPPLSATRTMGALASIAASRIARTFRCGGVSFTISGGEDSGLQALELAVRALQNREIDEAIVGAVDLAGDPREVLALNRNSVQTPVKWDEGAIALILKRSNETHGDHIYALLECIDRAMVPVQYPAGSYVVAPFLSCNPQEWKGTTGFPTDGELTGLSSLMLACLALDRQILPGSKECGSHYWLKDAEGSPRRAFVHVNKLSAMDVFNVVCFELRERDDPHNGVAAFDPTGRRREWLFAFQAGTISELGLRLQQFLNEIEHAKNDEIETLAQRCWNDLNQSTGPVRAAFVAKDMDELRSQLGNVLADWDESRELRSRTRDFPQLRDNVFLCADPLAKRGSLAFVYPGSGNHFDDMGRELGLLFPDVLRTQQRENQTLRSQYAVDWYWDRRAVNQADPRALLFAQVSIGTLVSDLLARFNIAPAAVIGYSLGESAGMFGTRAWKDRDDMYQRMQESTLFVSDLAAPFNSARAQWRLSDNETVDWYIGVIAASPTAVRQALQPGMKAYLLIINAADECVIGGERCDVEALIDKLAAPFWEVKGVTTAHCEVTEPVREPYWMLHHLPTTPPADVRYYSGAWGCSYDLNADSAADAITDAVLKTIDFPRVVDTAYADGVRIFVEIGPGSSCTRLISKNLGDRPHVVRPICVPGQDNYSMLLRLLAQLFVEGVPIDCSILYPETAKRKTSQREVVIPVGLHLPPANETNPRSHGPAWERTLLDAPASRFSANSNDPKRGDLDVERRKARVPTEDRENESNRSALAESSTVSDAMATQSAVIEAHDVFLRFSTTTQENLSKTLRFQRELLQQVLSGQWPVVSGLKRHAQPDFVSSLTTDHSPLTTPPRSLTFEQCQAFAVGSIASVLGPRFAEIDQFPTRVRLPDGPLMLVDRILQIDGEPCSLTSGRVVTEHAVHAERWYLDAGRIPTCIAVEAGQADLFLAGYLGIDFQTRGRAVYRLLDAAVTFHRSLPGVGEIIHYDIHIDRFFRQGNTYLFRFRFESTVNGEPLLTMSEGCAGFFTADELASGKGIVHTELDRRPIPGVRPADWEEFVLMRVEAYSAEQVDALRNGDLAAAFGPDFSGLNLRDPMRLPGGMLRTVHRIVHLDPSGGRYGLGLVRGEADIHPDDWFLTCHFVDDKVMPGTLMYECCMHTLRIFLMRMGWIGEEGETHCEPIPELASRLKCRGQVIDSTKLVAYEVSIKEFGYRPEPFVLCDALMYADGKPIVEITNMSLRMVGLTRDKLRQIWDRSSRPTPILYDTDRILAFAVGKPSEAFGEPYRIFDEQRVIARLPGPPYQFLDRITAVAGEPWKMVAGAVVEAEYDVPPDAWYFAQNRCPLMPFSVLLEVGLQPCGWLAAYVGSALTSDVDLSFRNLGGAATQFEPVGPDAGRLATTVKITRVSQSGGMIIQHYDLAIRRAGRIIYNGNTYFGFFAKSALANQVGLREDSVYQPAPAELESGGQRIFPRNSPFPDSMLRMVNIINWYAPTGGPRKLGAIEGKIKVDPEAWFFRAHFYQDPVWPGSLGLESALQMLKWVAHERWGDPAPAWQTVALQIPHTWTYRGQVIPTDNEVTVQVYITAIDDAHRILRADGYLAVDGRIIYKMTDFSVQG
jgi:acyl transferase domain-containing protein/3-hydroxymyristoyl/3-hydroxydecanoyl-(acyl carrier protein) dehydratase